MEGARLKRPWKDFFNSQLGRVHERGASLQELQHRCTTLDIRGVGEKLEPRARTWQMRTSALAMLHCSKKKRFIYRTDRPSDLREDDPDAITPEERADGLRHDL